MAVKKGGLGRGLDALFADAVPAVEPAEPEQKQQPAELPDDRERVQYLSIHDIMPNVNQPRKHFDEEKLDELARSIEENGIIQPIVVRRKASGYEIVAGERRWRASMKAGLTAVPCLIRELNDEQNMLIAIIENMQREDLNPMEEAEGLNQMITAFSMTQEEVSKSVGKSRPYIANSLRLLKLPDYVKEAISLGKLSAAHGRTLVAVENETKRKELCERIMAEGLSVRETEKLASQLNKGKQKKAAKSRDADLERVEEELKEALGTKVRIIPNGRKGKIEIQYFSADERERLIDLLRNQQN